LTLFFRLATGLLYSKGVLSVLRPENAIPIGLLLLLALLLLLTVLALLFTELARKGTADEDVPNNRRPGLLLVVKTSWLGSVAARLL
jgi:hypothetical protein